MPNRNKTQAQTAGPVAKKAKKQTQTAEPVAKKAKKQANPHAYKDAHFKRLEKIVARCGAEGAMLVAGIEEDSDDEEEDKVLTEEEVAQLRHIIITPRRAKELEAVMNQLIGDDEILMFDTQTGNDTICYIAAEVKKISKLKDPAKRFDKLLALTYTIKTYDSWLHDNEMWEPGEGCDEALLALAKAWRTTLQLPDSVLQIDPEFSRPGINALLQDFSDAVDQVNDELNLEFVFPWK